MTPLVFFTHTQHVVIGIGIPTISIPILGITTPFFAIRQTQWRTCRCTCRSRNTIGVVQRLHPIQLPVGKVVRTRVIGLVHVVVDGIVPLSVGGTAVYDGTAKVGAGDAGCVVDSISVAAASVFVGVVESEPVAGIVYECVA